MSIMSNDDRLNAAAKLGDIDCLYTLIQEDPHVLDYTDSISYADTPLHNAATFGHLHFATEIMRLKPSFAWKLNQQGFSPIHLAMQHQQKRMVLRFVDINKDLVRVKGREGLTPLHFASLTGETDLLANFLMVCPDSIEDVTVRSETALHIAVRYQQYEALQVIVGWLKRVSHNGAVYLERTILNWKDDADNTILHISALMNDLQAVRLLVKTRMDLNTKNLENLTALDITTSAEIKRILLKARGKGGSSVTDAPTLANNLIADMKFSDKIIVTVLRIRSHITEEQRNASLVVAALIVTAIYQSALSPPGGVYQANAGDNNVNSTSLDSTATATQGNVGTSIMLASNFRTLSMFNTFSLLLSTLTIYILTPGGTVGGIVSVPLFGAISFFVCSYFYSMAVISPTFTTTNLNLYLILFFLFSYIGLSRVILPSYIRTIQGYAKIREIGTPNSARGNRW